MAANFPRSHYYDMVVERMNLLDHRWIRALKQVYVCMVILGLFKGY